jgi:hypothetical protein
MRAWLDRAAVRTQPLRPPATAPAAIAIRAPSESPALALDDSRRLPQAIELPATPFVVAPAPPESLPWSWPPLRAAWGRPAESDPTDPWSRSAIVSRPPPLRQTPAPTARLSIPEPFENANAVRLVSPPPDDDPPARSFEAPASANKPPRK